MVWSYPDMPRSRLAITATIVLPGTILYHGESNKRLTKVGWLAFDPDHYFVFCQAKCYLYTYVTTRPFHLLSFDSSSTAKVDPSGALETQDIVIWGEVHPDIFWEEPLRIRELCR